MCLFHMKHNHHENTFRQVERSRAFKENENMSESKHYKNKSF